MAINLVVPKRFSFIALNELPKIWEIFVTNANNNFS